MLDVFALIILIVLFLTALAVIWLAATLPGKIALQRHHPKADAVGVAGWCSLLMPPLWPLALIWAYMEPRRGPTSNASE